MRNPSVGWRGKPLLGAVPSIALPAAYPTMVQHWRELVTFHSHESHDCRGDNSAHLHVRGNNDCYTHHTKYHRGISLVNGR